jgi:hypothetical protein
LRLEQRGVNRRGDARGSRVGREGWKRGRSGRKWLGRGVVGARTVLVGVGSMSA